MKNMIYYMKILHMFLTKNAPIHEISSRHENNKKKPGSQMVY